MKRRLSAILAADVVGYSRMIAADESATLDALHRLRSEIFGPVFADHHGRIVKSMGDGWLVEFDSAVEAVNAAMQVQDRLSDQTSLTLRMGIHIGDVTRNEDDLFGDGINIAARLEAKAPPGGILISDAVHAGLDGTLSPSFEPMGAQTLKNIDRPVVAWLRHPDGARTGLGTSAPPHQQTLPVLAIQPVGTSDTRADVLDLANALTADIQTLFGGISWLTTRIDAKPGPGCYVLRPTLRAQGDRLRLETRLMDPQGASVWAHKSDGTLSDSFDWQDRVVEEIAGTGTDLILEAETLRIALVPDTDLQPEQCLLMGMMAWRSFSIDSFTRSVEFQTRAIAARPDMADAYAEAIIVVCAGRTMGHMGKFEDSVPDWVRAARPLAAGHAMLTLAIATATYLHDQRQAPLNQAVSQVLRLAPFDARILSFCGWANLWSGQTRAALDCFEKSIELGKLGPFLVASYGGAATASLQLGDDERALDYCEKGFALSDSYPTLFSTKAAALALSGDLDAARSTMAQYRALLPTRSLAYWRRTNSYGGNPGAERQFRGLELAGLPLE